jgi:hypothetical protein
MEAGTAMGTMITLAFCTVVLRARGKGAPQ